MKHGKVWKKMKKDFGEGEYTEDPVPMKKKTVHAT